MAKEDERGLFTDSVKKCLSGRDDAESLWVSVAQEFMRDGPDAASAYLAGEKQGLVDRVRRQLKDVEGRINA